jgi:hypothetical protein
MYNGASVVKCHHKYSRFLHFYLLGIAQINSLSILFLLLFPFLLTTLTTPDVMQGKGDQINVQLL